MSLVAAAAVALVASSVTRWVVTGIGAVYLVQAARLAAT